MTKRATQEVREQLRSAVNTERLIDTAVKLVGVPSPTKSAGEVAARLEELLADDDFEVDRPEAGYPASPAVACRWQPGEDGRTLQFNGHIDTVHLPFVAPRVEDGKLYGSGASDMKGGFAAAVEATRALRDSGLLKRGAILLTAHDLHESPWGDGTQVTKLMDAGYLGDAVMLPEYLCDRVPVAGRGLATFKIVVRRDGDPVHEVLGGIDAPSVIYAGAEIVRRLAELDQEVATQRHPVAGRSSVFVGKALGGEIYNQAPSEFLIEGTRRWVPGSDIDAAEAQITSLAAAVADMTGTTVEVEFSCTRDAFAISPSELIVSAFQNAMELSSGQRLPTGAKPFVDDGNAFVAHGRIPAITHGPAAKGAHTTNEEVPIAELERVALVYALTAYEFCQS